MRSYIFTSAERNALHLLLNNRVKAADPSVAYILSRIRNFDDLAADVDLYLIVRKTMAATST